MKIWLDDLRLPPDGWTWIKDPIMCMKVLDEARSFIEVISLDHDLGVYRTGYDVICKIEQLVYTDESYIPPEIRIHSANPVGVERMEMVRDCMLLKLKTRKEDKDGKQEIANSGFNSTIDIKD